MLVILFIGLGINFLQVRIKKINIYKTDFYLISDCVDNSNNEKKLHMLNAHSKILI